MGRMLGAFDNDEELDRPDLNKCPDCGCFFEDDNCPLCGMRCPEDMRAGNRKAVKKKRHRKDGTQYRVTYIEWYHRWWFILLMMFVSPFSIAGIVLLITSPHKKAVKIAVVAVMIVYALISTFGLSNIVQGLVNLWDEPVDRSLSEIEYFSACETVDVESYCRAPAAYEEKFVALTLYVKEKIVDSDGYRSGSEYTAYYVCQSSDGRFTVLVRDCDREGFVLYPGDEVIFFGEGAGMGAIYDMSYKLHEAPVLNAAYHTLVE